MIEGEADVYEEAVRSLRHDARNLLNGLSVIAQHFEGSDDPRAEEFIAYITEKVETMVRLAERTDILAKMGAGERSRCDLRELIGEALKRTPNSGEVSVDVPDTDIECDHDLALLALKEVLDNAVRSEGDVRVTGFKHDDGLAVRVADNGPGVPEPALAHLLTPFRGARRQGGSSLGLPIADAAMRMQNGTVFLERPDEGKGTIVTLTWLTGESG